jgi:release factor glutamine methyltransferase
MADTTTQTWTIGRLLGWTHGFLTDKGLDEPRLAAELLLAAALDCRKIDLYTRFEQIPTAEQVDRFRALVRDAAAQKPIAYLVGHKEFYSLDFLVTPDVLIPRPETELLVEQAVAVARSRPDEPIRVLDIGTGSGCVAVAIAKLAQLVRVVATDVSPAALEIARTNAARNGVADRVDFVEADAAALPFERVQAGGFDVLVANPPYIAESARATLPVNVRDYEPHVALFGGPDGLDVIRRIAAGGRGLLAAHGRAFIEVADGQHERAAAVFIAAGWALIGVLPDAAGIPRVLALERGP